MNIAMMTNNYKPFVGGVPISIERLSEGLRERGHNVFIFAPEYAGTYADEPDVIRYRSFAVKMGVFVVPNSFDRRIGEAFAQLKIDVVHSHHPVFAGNSARVLARLHDVPLLFTWHTQYEKYLHHIKTWGRLEKKAEAAPDTLAGKLAGRIVKTGRERVVLNWVRRYANSCDAVFAPSESMKRILAAHGVSSHIQVMPTGLPGGFFEPDAKRTAAIRRKHLEGKKYLFCTVTRLSEEKNTAFLLEGLAVLKERLGDAFKLLLIGMGPQREAMEALARQRGLGGNVEFMGGIPNERLSAYYAAADLFLFASKTETQGIVLLEAMAGRTPVVALEADGVCDVVRNGVNGFLTDENPGHFAGAIARLLENMALYKKISHNAWQGAQRYTAQNMAHMAEKVYRRAVRARSKEALHAAVEAVYNLPKLD